VVYLGEADASSNFVFDAIRAYFRPNDNIPGTLTARDVLERYLMDPEGSYSAWACFFNRPWFTRTWM
jgi:hypothetical protein